MKASRVFDLLKLLNESDEIVRRNGHRVLKYIYQDVYRDYLEEGKKKVGEKHNYGSNNYESAVKPYKTLEKEISSYLDGGESILTYFIEMAKDNKPEFIKLFSDKIDIFFEMIDNHYYDSSDFASLSLTFNLYAMLRAYHSHKDDFELFSKIVNDCDCLIDCISFVNNVTLFGYFSTSGIENLEIKKKFMDSLIDCRWYDKTNVVPEHLKKLFHNITASSSYSDSTIKPTIKVLTDIDKVYSDFLELQEAGVDVNIDTFEKIANRIVLNANSYRKVDIFYDKKLLIGNRFEYFNSVLPKIISASKMKDNLATRILNMNFLLFDELDKQAEDNSDSFERIMDMVLDSDSFYEVSSKLNDIEKACSLFTCGKLDEAKDLIQELRSTKHKKVLDDGRIVGVLRDTINPVNSGYHRSVEDRMIDSYRKLYPNYNVSYLISSALNRDPGTIEAFTTVFDESLNNLILKEKAKEEYRRELERQKQERQERERLEALAEQERQKQLAEEEKASKIEAVPVVEHVTTVIPSVGLSEEVPNSIESVTEQRLGVYEESQPKEESGFAKLKSIFGKRG